MARTKRLVVISDLHAGHRVGLTPPDYQWKANKNAEHGVYKCAKIQRACWKWYKEAMLALRPIDVLVVNGDAIDGRGERSGGVELITGDRRHQADMAAEAILLAGAKQVVMVRGTPYHTGQKEDWEDVIARKVRACKIGNHEWVNINGIVFDFKHKIGRSTIPHGQFTPQARDWLWNALWAEAGFQPKADWLIRSHVHYARDCGGWSGDRRWVALTTPALQAMGTRYGARECSNLVDYGFNSWDITPNGSVTWQPKIAYIRSQRAKAIVL